MVIIINQPPSILAGGARVDAEKVPCRQQVILMSRGSRLHPMRVHDQERQGEKQCLMLQCQEAMSGEMIFLQNNYVDSC